MMNDAVRAGLGALALFLSSAAANAQMGDPLVNPRGLMPNFDAVNLGPVLTELGIVWQEKALADGTRYIEAAIGGELTFVIVPAACIGANGTQCVGANILASFTGGRANPQTVSAFSQKYAFISAGVTSDSSSAYVSRYEIADYGIPRGNVASSLYNFFELARRFREEVSLGDTISADGYVEDMAASYLNIESGEAIGVDAAIPGDGSLAALHRAGFEATPQLVRTLMSSDAPKNKIDNIVR